MKKIYFVLIGVLIIVIYILFFNKKEVTNDVVVEVDVPLEVETSVSTDYFSNRDYNTEINDENYVTISLNDNNISVDGSGVSIDSSIVTITEEGSYVVSGSLSDGSIIVDVLDTEKVQIVLDNVSISSSTTAAINVVSADKVFVTMLSNTKNIINVNILEDAYVDAGIFSKSDLTLNGDGVLNINVVGGAGIVSKDELTITSGTYNINSDGHGLDSNDGIAIADGVFNIESGKDGLHSEHSTNSEKGYVYIVNGEFNIEASQDGIDSGAFLEIVDGNFDIITGEGWESAPVKVASANTMGGVMQRPGIFNNTTTTTTTTSDSTSRKCLKSDGTIRIYDGVLTLDCYDDGIHSDSLVDILGGEFVIGTADDAIHANYEVVIRGGNILIENSFEGIEAQRIYITGGYIDMYCGDDGINASGANLDPNDSTISITITGGVIIMDTNEEGDGLDSNGSILITGGDILISSTTDVRDTALDSEGSSIIYGGSFVATGSYSQTLQNFNSGSTQGSILYVLSKVQTGDVTLTDSSGNVLVDYTPAKEYQAVTISLEQLVVGGKYYLTAGDYSETITLSSLQYSNVSTGMNSGMTNRR